MKFKTAEKIELIADIVTRQSFLRRGTVGEVVHVHENGSIEVELFDEDGWIIGIYTVKDELIERKP
jgi:hypothetical protein